MLSRAPLNLSATGDRAVAYSGFCYAHISLRRADPPDGFLSFFLGSTRSTAAGRWWINYDGVELFRPARIKVERYQYRGARILLPWMESLELGMLGRFAVPLSPIGPVLLFEVFSQCCERGSIMVISNLPFDEWTGVFASERLTGALLDHLTHHVTYSR